METDPEWDDGMTPGSYPVDSGKELALQGREIEELKKDVAALQVAFDKKEAAIQAQLDRRFGGAEVSLKDFKIETRQQLKELSATVTSGFKTISDTNSRIMLALFGIIGSLAAGAILYALTLR